ncbi:MAG: SusE domain-containing protein [Flavobacteriaceae bacterium]
MKNNIITFLTKTILPVALLFIAFSCENEDDGPEFTVTPPSEDVAFTNSFLDDYLLSAQTSANIAERLLWNTPSFGAQTSVTFTVEGSSTNLFAATDPGYFSSGALTENNYAVSVANLLAIADALDLDGDPTSDKDSSGMAYLRVTASVGDATDSNGSSVVSEPQEIKITMVETEGEAPVPMLAVPGQYQGWNPGGAPLLAASAAGQTDFEGFIYMDIDEADNQGFKFVEGVDGVYDWGNPDWGQSKTDAQGTLVIEDEDNVKVDADGLYYLQVDTGAGTYSTTLMSLGLIGDATPGGWGSDTDFVYDATNNVLTLDINLINGNKYKVRANDDWVIEFPGQFGPDSDGDGFLDTHQGDWVHEGDTGNYRVTLDVFTARKYTLTVTAL